MSNANSGPTLNEKTAQQLATWARYTQARQVVRIAANALGDEAELMPLKGVLLTALGIRHPATRPMRDVDLLLRTTHYSLAVKRLGAVGFRIADVPRASGYVSLEHPAHVGLWVDLHWRLMPAGLGRLRRQHLFSSATRDRKLFGAPVWVPAPLELTAHLLANIVKDRVVHAYPHAPFDLAATAGRLSNQELSGLDRFMRHISLHKGAILAALWAQQRAPSPALARLVAALQPDVGARAKAERELAHRASVDHGNVLARLRARTDSDSWLQRTTGPFIAALGLAARPGRATLLHLANRSDDSRGLR